MPASPTPAQADTSRRNGAQSTGPLTPEGKARSALNATRHNLHGPFGLLPEEDAAAFEALRAGLEARHAPADAVEAHWVEEIAFAMWRQRRLRALEVVTLAHAEIGTDEPGASARLPSLATLARYRARVERDLRLAGEHFAAARTGRPRLPVPLGKASAPRLRWLAERLEQRAATPANSGGTNEPEPATLPTLAGESDGPGGRANEPEPAARHPNRAERRRRAALARKAGSAAA